MPSAHLCGSSARALTGFVGPLTRGPRTVHGPCPYHKQHRAGSERLKLQARAQINPAPRGLCKGGNAHELAPSAYCVHTCQHIRVHGPRGHIFDQLGEEALALQSTRARAKVKTSLWRDHAPALCREQQETRAAWVSSPRGLRRRPPRGCASAAQSFRQLSAYVTKKCSDSLAGVARAPGCAPAPAR